MLDAVHQTARPDKFSGEQTEAKKNHYPAGARRHQHDNTDKQQCKTGNDAKDAADLFDGAKRHEVFLAERVGFEPTVGVNLHTLSKRAP